MLTFADVRAWRPGPLGSAADGLRRSITSLEAARDDVERRAVPDSWWGLSQLMARTRQQVLVSSMDGRIETARTLVRALVDAETSVAALQRSVDDVEGEARAKEVRIGADGSVEDLAEPPTFESRWEAEEYTDIRQGVVRGIADEVGRIVDRAAEIDSALLAAVPYRTEEQELRGLADPVVAQRWGELSDAERRAVLEQIVEEELDDLDLDPPPDVTFVDPDTSTDPKYQALTGFNGYFWGSDNEIWIHPDRVADPEALSTAAHEARHRRQSDAVDDLDQSPWEWLTGNDPFDKHEDAGVSEEEAEAWKENWSGNNYIDAPYEDYIEQPVEEDAFDAGSDYLDDLTPEELERLLEESA